MKRRSNKSKFSIPKSYMGSDGTNKMAQEIVWCSWIGSRSKNLTEEKNSFKYPWSNKHIVFTTNFLFLECNRIQGQFDFEAKVCCLDSGKVGWITLDPYDIRWFWTKLKRKEHNNEA